jgi:L-aspartate oxidase
MPFRKVDFLIVGSGIAGLSFALKAAKLGKVLIVTKSNEDESNTKYAQGGVAVVTDHGDIYKIPRLREMVCAIPRLLKTW